MSQPQWTTRRAEFESRTSSAMPEDPTARGKFWPRNVLLTKEVLRVDTVHARRLQSIRARSMRDREVWLQPKRRSGSASGLVRYLPSNARIWAPAQSGWGNPLRNGNLVETTTSSLKRGAPKALKKMAGTTGIEPVTPTMSRKVSSAYLIDSCVTAELVSTARRWTRSSVPSSRPRPRGWEWD
ncbi:hypothetical protein EHH60_35970 [Bradyrhizobium sp. RP6]|nr:hypothetical protein EHH60_35970 [Bradyrhizobium sp. RP6]